MGTYEMFDHTADVGLRVVGETLDDLFETAAKGLFDYIVTNREAVEPRESLAVDLASESSSRLLVVWLNELIFLLETQHVLFKAFHVKVAADGLSLVATVEGEPIDRDRHVLDHEIKAVTYHDLDLSPTSSGWQAELILDI